MNRPNVETLKRIIELDDTRRGCIFAIVIQSLIVLSLVTFSIETLPDLPASAQRTLDIIKFATVTIFTIEYILRIIAADRTLGFIFSFYGLIDLLSILPFYIASGVDLRSVRAFRLLRLFRIFKLVRDNRAFRRFH
jgi:voltage-gated potassium channel